MRILFSHDAIDLADAPFNDKILRDPNDRVNRKKDSEIGQNSTDAVMHPMHEIGDWKSRKGTYGQVRRCLPKNAPTIRFPNDGSASPGCAIQKGADRLQQNGLNFCSASACQFGDDRIKLSIPNGE